jgi:multisubunit Na+/H+ antiporter MnhG subunit
MVALTTLGLALIILMAIVIMLTTIIAIRATILLVMITVTNPGHLKVTKIGAIDEGMVTNVKVLQNHSTCPCCYCF